MTKWARLSRQDAWTTITRRSSPLHVIMRCDHDGGQNPAPATLDRSAGARHSRYAALDSLDRHRYRSLGGEALTVSNHALLRHQRAHRPANVLSVSRAPARPAGALVARVSPFSSLRCDYTRPSLFTDRRIPALRDKISSPRNTSSAGRKRPGLHSFGFASG